MLESDRGPQLHVHDTYVIRSDSIHGRTRARNAARLGSHMRDRAADRRSPTVRRERSIFAAGSRSRGTVRVTGNVSQSDFVSDFAILLLFADRVT